MKKLWSKLSLFCLLCICVIGIVGCTPNDAEYKEIVSCAEYMKSIMKDPESFSVYGTCTYTNKYDEADDVYKIYISIPYRAANSFGAYVTNTGYFVDGVFVGTYNDYEDDSYEDWSISRRIDFLQAIIAEMEGYYTASYDADTVNKGLK